MGRNGEPGGRSDPAIARLQSMEAGGATVVPGGRGRVEMWRLFWMRRLGEYRLAGSGRDVGRVPVRALMCRGEGGDQGR